MNSNYTDWCGTLRLQQHRSVENPLFGADLNRLKNLVEAGSSVNVFDPNGFLLLNYVMDKKQVDVFDYLMSLDETDVNLVDRWGETPLIYLARYCFDEYFARRLIDKGADIHFVDSWGSTFLSHMTGGYKCDDGLSIGQLVVEKGADINWRNHDGRTPLYNACACGNFAWACMLLYYGADVTIATNDRVLPLFAVSSDMPENQQFLLEEILYNYTFDNDKVSMKLPTLVVAMTGESELFLKILERVSDIDYDLSDLHYMASLLVHIKTKHLEIFVMKFSHIIQELINSFALLNELFNTTYIYKMHELQGIINFFLESDYAADFVQSSVPGESVIAELLRLYNKQLQTPSVEDFTKMISVMLTYGLTVTSNDLDGVYFYFGYCDLFKILLHMDIVMIDPYYETQSIAALYYNPSITIDVFFYNVYESPALLDYFNDYKLKKAIISDNNLYGDNVYDDETLERVKNLPQIPLLVELSRNAARKYIVNHFKIKKSVQFYTILKWLPIGDVNRSIIALEKKLY